MNISNILNKNCVNLNMKHETKEEVLKELIEMLYKNGIIDNKDKFYEEVCFRENAGSTAVGNYIAIPHGKSYNYAKTLSIAIGKTTSEIEWGTIDSFPVKFIILFATPNIDESKDQMRMMADICRKLGRDEVCNKLLECKNYDEIVEILI